MFLVTFLSKLVGLVLFSYSFYLPNTLGPFEHPYDPSQPPGSLPNNCLTLFNTLWTLPYILVTIPNTLETFPNIFWGPFLPLWTFLGTFWTSRWPFTTTMDPSQHLTDPSHIGVNFRALWWNWSILIVASQHANVGWFFKLEMYPLLRQD